MAADVAGYTRLMERDESGTVAAWRAARTDIIDPTVVAHDGRIVKLTGDGFLAEFPTVERAVRCALALQQAFSKRFAAMPEDRRVAFRIGVNIGDVYVDRDDIYGTGVNVAARLEGLAEAGGICVSDDVYHQVRGKLDAVFEDMGEHALKNVAEPVRVYRVGPPGAEATPPPPGKAGAGEALALPDKPSIAVLAFENMSGDPEQEYFSDGISEDIITELSRVHGLFVIARNSSFTYKGKATSIRQIGRELGVGAVLEGSVRKAGNRVRVTAQLIDATNDGHLWAERYDRDLEDIFTVQDEITQSIAKSLAGHLVSSRDNAGGDRETASIEAYDLFLRGRHNVGLTARDANSEAKAQLEKAIALDPGFSSAHAVLSVAYLLDYLNDWGDAAPEEAHNRARKLAERAVALNDRNAFAYWSLAIVTNYEKGYEKAAELARRSLALDENLTQAYTSLGVSLLGLQQPEEALAMVERGLRRDPQGPSVNLHTKARALFLLRRFEDAAEVLRERIRRSPSTDLSRVLLAAVLGFLGRGPEARQCWEEALARNPNYSLERRRQVLPEAEFELLMAGLGKAGLPPAD